MGSSQTKDYNIGKNAALRTKNKELSGQNQNNVSEWNDISTHCLRLSQVNEQSLKYSIILHEKQHSYEG
jgi:hypothetical protein